MFQAVGPQICDTRIILNLTTNVRFLINSTCLLSVLIKKASILLVKFSLAPVMVRIWSIPPKGSCVRRGGTVRGDWITGMLAMSMDYLGLTEEIGCSVEYAFEGYVLSLCLPLSLSRLSEVSSFGLLKTLLQGAAAHSWQCCQKTMDRNFCSCEPEQSFPPEHRFS